MQTSQSVPAIQKTPDVCGGDACIRNMRMPVWLLVSYRKDGATDEWILDNYPDLTREDLANAWDYYERNTQEIEEAIAAQEADLDD